MSAPFLLGVAGGSGSGKTFFAKALQNLFSQPGHQQERVELVYQDNFYFDQSAKFDFDGGSVNFDHPDAIDFASLAKHLEELKSGQNTQIPIYDFVTHKRKSETLMVRPTKLVIVDGILIFHKPEVRALFNEMVFFETPEDLRFQRRLERDVIERGRTPEGVQNQFYKQVKPMHDQFVEPSKQYAQRIVRDNGEYLDALRDYQHRFQGIV